MISKNRGGRPLKGTTPRDYRLVVMAETRIVEMVDNMKIDRESRGDVIARIVLAAAAGGAS